MRSSLTPLILSHSTSYSSANAVCVSCKIYLKYNNFSPLPLLLPWPKPPSPLIRISAVTSGLGSLLPPLLPGSQFQQSSRSDSNRVITQHIFTRDISRAQNLPMVSHHYTGKKTCGFATSCTAAPLSLSSSLCFSHTGLHWLPCGIILIFFRSLLKC